MTNLTNLTNLSPSDVQYVADAAIFYFGVRADRIGELPGKAEFHVVYSPREGRGWEYAYYRVFDKRNGIAVLEDRPLEPDEQSYFEAWIERSKMETGHIPKVTRKKSRHD